MRRYGTWAGNPKGTVEDKTKCIESISTSDRAHLSKQCSKPRGYGENGLYCKQHAKDHPDTSKEYPKIFIAFFDYKPVLSKAKLVKETKVRATIIDVENIIGRAYLPNTFDKSKYPIFQDEGDARVYLSKLIDDKIQNLKNKIKELESYHKEI